MVNKVSRRFEVLGLIFYLFCCRFAREVSQALFVRMEEAIWLLCLLEIIT